MSINDFDYQLFEKNLEKQSSLNQLRGKVHVIDDPELEQYFTDNMDSILDFLRDEYFEGDKDDVIDTLETLGLSEEDL